MRAAMTFFPVASDWFALQPVIAQVPLHPGAF